MDQAPLIQVRRSAERGHANHGWLNTYHTFSFGDYFDDQHMSFRTMRVINEDSIAAGEGFGSHPHKDMEIVTMVLEGALAHKDSMGNASVIKAGDVQRMSAGTGVIHSEFNHSLKEHVDLFQVWILPEQKGSQPSYEQKAFSKNELTNQLRLIVSKDGTEGSVKIHQDVKIYGSILESNQEIDYITDQRRGLWIQVRSGAININNEITLSPGDGASIENTKNIKIKAAEKSHFFLFDLY